MIDDMSPFAQRVLALGLLLLALLLSTQFVAAPIIERMEVSRSALADSRYRLHKLKAAEARPDPATGQRIAPSSLIKAANLSQAQAQLAGHVARIASTTSVKLRRIEGEDKQALASLVTAQIELQASEALLISFVDELEAGQPVMRLRNWRLENNGDESGELRLTAKLVASWEKRR